MLTLCLTYLEVMPEFLDLLMIFGKQSRPQHFYQSSFRYRSRLSAYGIKTASRQLIAPELGWSGQDLQICYNLKSVEPSSQGDWPWSIRDSAIDHSFDVKSTRVIWIIVKGNSLIEERIRSATTDPNTVELSSFETPGEAFTSTLMTHLLFCELVSENWNQFLVFIEARSHEISKSVLSNKIDVEPHITREPRINFVLDTKRAPTGGSAKLTVSSFSHKRRGLFAFQESNYDGRRRATDLTESTIESAPGIPDLPGFNGSVTAEYDYRGQREFTFDDLQELQYIRDKINEAVLVLELNQDVLSQLLQYYENLRGSSDFPPEIFEDSRPGWESFRLSVKSHINYLHKCVLRFRALGDNISGSMRLVSLPIEIMASH